MNIPIFVASLFNEKHLPWPEPHLSIGSPCKNIHGLRCWEATGPALKLMNDIAGSIRKLLEDNVDSLEKGQQKCTTIAYKLWMIGSAAEVAAPHLIIISQSHLQRKRAKDLLRDSFIFRDHPELGLKALNKRPAVLRTNGEGPAETTNDFIQITIEDAEAPHDHCATLVRINGDRNATISGILVINGLYWGMISHHSCIQMDASELDLEDDCESLYFDSSDGEEMDEVEATSRGSVSSDKESPTSYPSDCSSHRDQIPELEPLTPPIIAIRQRIQEGKTLPTSSSGTKVATIVTASTLKNLDYELLPLNPLDFPHRNRVRLPGADDVSRGYLNIEGIIKQPEDNSSILALTGNTGCVKGIILDNHCYMKVHGSRTFQEMWQVRLERRTQDGDSGAWIVDETTGKIHGHIVAGDPGSNVAFIIPIHSVFKDIEERFRAVPRLLSNEDLVDVAPAKGNLSMPDIIWMGQQGHATSIFFVHHEDGRSNNKLINAAGVPMTFCCPEKECCCYSQWQYYTTGPLVIPCQDTYCGLILVARGNTTKTCRFLATLVDKCNYWLPRRLLGRFMTQGVHAPYGDPAAGPLTMRIRPHHAKVFQLAALGDLGSLRQAFAECSASPFDVDCKTGESLLHIVLKYLHIPVIQYLLTIGVERLTEGWWSEDICRSAAHGMPSMRSPQTHAGLKIFEKSIQLGILNQLQSCFPEMPDHFNFPRVTRVILGLYKSGTLQELDSAQINANAYTSEGRTALYWACCRSDTEALGYLLRSRPNQNTLDEALMVACARMSEICVQLLLSHGAKPNSRSREGQTPLHHLFGACQQPLSERCEDHDITRLLLYHGLDIQHHDPRGRNYLCYAAMTGSVKSMDLILAAGCSIDHQDRSGWTPLFYAIMGLSQASLAYLLELGASTEFKDIRGRTLLHYVARYPSVEVVTTLLNSDRFGLSPDAKDDQGMRASDYLVAGSEGYDDGKRPQDWKFPSLFHQLLAKLRTSRGHYSAALRSDTWNSAYIADQNGPEILRSQGRSNQPSFNSEATTIIDVAEDEYVALSNVIRRPDSRRVGKNIVPGTLLKTDATDEKGKSPRVPREET